jgi:hypothetical protein
MHVMQEVRLVIGIKPKPKGIADDAWVRELNPSQCVMY